MRFSQSDVTVAQNYESGGWATEGAQVNPTAGTIVADTGELAAGIYDFLVMAATTTSFAATDFSLEHRNADNTANVSFQRIAAHVNIMLITPVFTLKMAEGERLRIETLVNTAYTVQMSIIYVQRTG